ncbi:MAG: peptide chain release factor 1 [Candidatus Omnitrophica bacterium]|nr:peptide chain release factor 1 [Candidatus Omnitrophota bacterium]
MDDKVVKLQARFNELEHLLADPSVIADQGNYQNLAREYSDISPIVSVLREIKANEDQINGLVHLLKEKHDSEFEELAKSELEELTAKKTELEAKLFGLLNPKKEEKSRDLIIEIRAGTGGEEASLFAGDLYRMYAKYADKNGWKVEQMSGSPSETGGIKEVIFSISGKGASKYLKWESGAHRVQRVPTTEASGRIHTSAATVAVLFEPEEIDIKIEPKDLKIDIFRSSGPGGQSVNTTDSAVRMTHIPTGIVVTCQDERSQLKNRSKAMRVMRARLMDKMQSERSEKEARERKTKIGSGDRSEKIRTYNFPDRRVTDHRIGFTTHKLDNVIDGELDELTEALLKAEEEGLLS